MSIFLDNTHKRKWYFRTSIVVVYFAIVGIFVSFAYIVLFDKTARNSPIKYSDTKESYHYYSSPANKMKVAITFDDGPEHKITRQIAQSLKKKDVPAMFYFVGQNIFLNPNLVKEVYDMGFDIGNHSFTHDEKIHSSQNRLNLELRSTNYLLKKITGELPVYYRPPFLLGIGTNPTVNPYESTPKDILWTLENGLVPNGIDIDPKDWVQPTQLTVIEKLDLALDETPNGHIILLHENKQTADAIEGIVDLLHDRGYKIVPLSELLTPPTYINLSNDLVFGMTDANTNREVSKLQWFLYKQGDLDPYLLTGKFDASTKHALTSFQLRNNLIDPNNVNPSRVGVADLETRNFIDKYTTIASVQTDPQKSDTPLASTVRKTDTVLTTAYINFLPTLRMSIIWMTRVALGFVILRVILLLLILIYGWLKIKIIKEVSVFKNSEDQRGVTVLIPAYNEEENIRGTIESVINSHYTNKEIIVINDGSTDKTADIASAVISGNPNHQIKLIEVENGGKASALNHGIKESKFDICVVIDADAVLDKEALHYFVPHFNDPKIGAVAGKIKTTGNGGFLNLFQTLEYAIGQNIDKRVFSTVGAVGIVPGPAGAWRRELIIKAGGFSNDTLVEDQDMTLTFLSMGKRVVYEPRAISFTETPNNVKDFLKQRFRWIYGTIQCFWKNKISFIKNPFSVMSLIVLPNIFIFNILLPLTYPFADLAFVVGIIFGEWQHMVLPFLLFTGFDVIYAWIGVVGENNSARLLVGAPLQRFSYRQLIYYTVIKSVVRAIEGTATGWNKFTKSGETQRFFFSTVKEDKIVTGSF